MDGFGDTHNPNNDPINMAARRFPAHTVARFVDDEGERSGVLFDLSRTGALLSTTAAIRPGARGTLNLTSYRTRNEVTFGCRVARQAVRPEVGLGLAFTSMSHAAQLWLNNYCAFFGERGRIVMIDRDPAALTLMERILTTEGYKFIGLQAVAGSERAVRRIQPLLVMIDADLAEGDDGALVARLQVEPAPHILLSRRGCGTGLSQQGLPIIGTTSPRLAVIKAVQFALTR